jgi:hypothetical protein
MWNLLKAVQLLPSGTLQKNAVPVQLVPLQVVMAHEFRELTACGNCTPMKVCSETGLIAAALETGVAPMLAPRKRRMNG